METKEPLNPDLVTGQFQRARDGVHIEGARTRKPKKALDKSKKVLPDGLNQFEGARDIHRALSASSGSDLDGGLGGK